MQNKLDTVYNAQYAVHRHSVPNIAHVSATFMHDHYSTTMVTMNQSLLAWNLQLSGNQPRSTRLCHIHPFLKRHSRLFSKRSIKTNRLESTSTENPQPGIKREKLRDLLRARNLTQERGRERECGLMFALYLNA